MSVDAAVLRRDASHLLQQFPDEMLAALVAMMKGAIASRHGGGATHNKQDIALEADDEVLRFDGLPSVRGEPGIAAGEFVLPEDFDSDDEMIADLFEGRL